MASDPQTLSIVRALRGRISNTTKAIALHLADALPEDTPKDTGHAASNWVPSLGEPAQGVQGSKKQVTNAAQEAGRAEVAAASDLSRTPVWNCNEVDYIQTLNSPLTPSKKAPPYFVQIAMKRAAEAGRKVR